VATPDFLPAGYDHLAEKGYRFTQVAQRADPGILEKHLPLSLPPGLF